MHPNALHHVAASLDVYPFSPVPGELDWLCCPRCSTILALHQPDEETPTRLLGVCQVCKQWTLVDLAEETAEALMVLLPDGDWVRTRLGAVGQNNPSVGSLQGDAG